MMITETELAIDEARCQHFAALLSSIMEKPVDEIPIFAPVWHWLFTHETPAHAELGLDGHPVVRPVGVPASFTRRLWASSTLHFEKQITPGQRLFCRTTVEQATIKSGRSGELAFVPVQIEVFDDDSLVLTECRIGAYRPDELQSKQQQNMSTAPSLASIKSRSIVFSEVDLFRYSMVLRVCHRIHYDYIYTTQIEKFPGLVIHGPLLGQVLVYFALSHFPNLYVKSMTVKTFKPNFLGSPVNLHVGYDNQQDCVIAWALNVEGITSMKIELR